MYLGSSALSPSARRRFLMAALMLWSNSTMVSFGQSFFLISSRLTSLALALHQHAQDLQRLFLQDGILIVGAEFSAPQVEFEGHRCERATGCVCFMALRDFGSGGASLTSLVPEHQ